MMTTTSAFGPSSIRNSLIQDTPAHAQIAQSQSIENTISPQDKLHLLQQAIADFSAKKITKEQFQVISDSLR